MEEPRPRVSVLMPTFRQAEFISRAIASLQAQELRDWELVIVDDGSPGEATRDAVQPHLNDPRISYQRLVRNRGLGAALNHAFDHSRGPLIAYLPSDDTYFQGHLSSLAGCLDEMPQAALAYSGVRNEYRVPGKGVLNTRTTTGVIADFPLQLVQVMHYRSDDRWIERHELVTDDLEYMFWQKLRSRGQFVATGRITCEWVDHPFQRHKIIREPLGGINPYRARYQVAEPLRFQSSVGNRYDELEYYRRFRERPDTPMASDGLRILLVGELAFNPERVLALEEHGHKLFGLWTPHGHWFNTVGPLPFGHVQDVPRDGWRDAVRHLQPDLIYAQLNWEAVPFAHDVLMNTQGIPFVWHFKESPFDCIANGTWPLLVDLLTRSDGQVYISAEAQQWFQLALAERLEGRPALVLDGDLPKRDWFAPERSPRLSVADGQIHTLLAGGAIGIEPALVGQLARHDIHLHFYGDFHRGVFGEWIAACQKAAPRHLHLHPQLDQSRWVTEFSKYDAGWLHLIKSENEGELRRAKWSDLNLPARLPTLASAGVPFIQYDNGTSRVATQSVAHAMDVGLFFADVDELVEKLHDQRRMDALQERLWGERDRFCFDHHTERLVAFFRKVIETGTGKRI